MISVYLGDFNYRYNGTVGILTNMTNGLQLTLSDREVSISNGSNEGLRRVIAKYKDTKFHLENWTKEGVE